MNAKKLEEKLTLLAGRIKPEARITVLTGAGISAASGVPTFRGSDGLWKSFRVEELATPEAFRRDPRLVWEWYNWRREVVAKCRPNSAHEVLAAWSRRYPRFQLITQNVDGLHERAGTRDVIRFHGSIWEVLCLERCSASPSRWWDDTVPYTELPPLCPYCGGYIRPGIVWFGESIDSSAMNRSVQAAACDLFISAGTSAVVYPAAGLMYEARRNQAFTVEMNLETTPASGIVDLPLRGPVEELFLKLEELLLGRA